MKSYSKYIFDEDYTILIPDWSKEDDFFRKVVPLEEQEEFFKQKQDILVSFEEKFPRYDVYELSKYFKSFGFSLSPEDILSWMAYNGEMIEDEVPEGTIELFKYLHENGKNITILTNWFGGTQIARLKRSGLYQYVDKVIAGEVAMKNSLDAFKAAIGDTPKEECIMIGDNPKNDIFWAQKAGIDSYLVDKEHTIKDFYGEVKGRKGARI